MSVMLHSQNLPDKIKCCQTRATATSNALGVCHHFATAHFGCPQLYCPACNRFKHNSGSPSLLLFCAPCSGLADRSRSADAASCCSLPVALDDSGYFRQAASPNAQPPPDAYGGSANASTGACELYVHQDSGIFAGMIDAIIP